MTIFHNRKITLIREKHLDRIISSTRMMNGPRGKFSRFQIFLWLSYDDMVVINGHNYRSLIHNLYGIERKYSFRGFCISINLHNTPSLNKTRSSKTKEINKSESSENTFNGNGFLQHYKLMFCVKRFLTRGLFVTIS